WVGPDFWANRLQDWRLQNGRLECLVDSAEKPMRTVHLLTGRLEEKDAAFSLQIHTGPAIDGNGWSPGAAAGFLVGAGKDMDYRAAALIHHAPGPGGGLFFGMDAEGRLFIRDNEESNTCLAIQDDAVPPPDDVVLHLDIQPGTEGYSVHFECRDGGSGKILGRLQMENALPVSRLTGNLALVSHPGNSAKGSRFWFSEWVISGDKFTKYPDRNCGPIISTQYTVDRNILKLTAQIMPLAQEKKDQVKFQTRSEGQWVTRAECDIADYAYTATFRIEGWDDTTDTPYRVFYRMPKTAGQERIFTREGVIRRNPVDKETIVVAAFTGNHNTQSAVDGKKFPWSTGLWFPHPDIIRHVAFHRPDVLFFSGDQIYQGNSPTAADFSHPFLDYLYKWYLWCWAFRDLTADIPSVIEPDDHDVFHGNLWGVGGKATEPGKTGAEAQDSGGYKLTPVFVNMVERTQTSHLPDPFDPTPVQQGIGVYYCALNWGGVSFAVIEDRKFKSAPKPLLPEAEIWDGWYQNEGFNPKTEADVSGAKLLGDRQLDFLDLWTADWSGG
ncbi:MAG: hypothetical protein MUP70_07765, partial [Candidatus Aminicenantes bacterium]|nr:hypothetical protein [Candidatus Aminicenantes bacterium]